MTTNDIAEAFSAHRFEETFEHLAVDARWVLVGQATLQGRDAIVAACRHSAAEMAAATTTFTRFVSTGEGDVVAVDVVARYVDAAGDASVVSSCDIYEFEQGALTTITSYAVELTDG